MIRPIIPPVVCSLSTCPLVLVKKRSRASDFDSLEYTWSSKKTNKIPFTGGVRKPFFQLIATQQQEHRQENLWSRNHSFQEDLEFCSSNFHLKRCHFKVIILRQWYQRKVLCGPCMPRSIASFSCKVQGKHHIKKAVSARVVH